MNQPGNDPVSAAAAEAAEAAHQLRDSRLRSILKAVSWRCVGTLDTFLVSFVVLHFLGGENPDMARAAKISSGIAATEVVTKICLYYFHERAWAQVPLGTIRRVFRRQ